MRIIHLLFTAVLLAAISCQKEKEVTPEFKPKKIKLSKSTSATGVVNYEYDSDGRVTKNTVLNTQTMVTTVTHFTYDSNNRPSGTTRGDARFAIEYSGDGRIQKTLSFYKEKLDSYRNFEYTDSSVFTKSYLVADTVCIWIIEYVLTADKKNLLAFKSLEFPYHEQLRPSHIRWAQFDNSKNSDQVLLPLFGAPIKNAHPFYQSYNVQPDGSITYVNSYTYEFNEDGYVTKMMGTEFSAPTYFEYIYLD